MEGAADLSRFEAHQNDFDRALVEIESGPLSGLTGTVITVKNEMRLVLSVKLLHRSVLTELDRDWVRPTNRKLAASA